MTGDKDGSVYIVQTQMQHQTIQEAASSSPIPPPPYPKMSAQQRPLDDYDEDLRPAVLEGHRAEVAAGNDWNTVEYQCWIREDGARNQQKSVEKSDAFRYVPDVVKRHPDRGNIDLATVKPKGAEAGPRIPCIFFIHGGIRIGSNRFVGLEREGSKWAKWLNAMTVSVEYGLAPDKKATEQLDNCYDALRHVFAQIKRGAAPFENVDVNKVIVYGASAGGGLALSLAIKWKNEQPNQALRGLFIEAGMLDDRDNTASCKQFKNTPMFNCTLKHLGWAAALGEDRAGKLKESDVKHWEAPAHAEADDLRRMPPTYMFVGSADPLCDENKRMARLLEEANVDVEARIWRGAFHGFFAAVPNAEISIQAVRDGLGWMKRILGVELGEAGYNKMELTRLPKLETYISHTAT
ncbi:Uu.00g057560.m01.CDS01 [Anthostomella pinea]|uniref:Uu.00g057560.m01.CDS01 n=1 Tax=Anthostomella pinea TaxID=933095 RepID=A0AAI8YJS4_9PEZI|nr:Uu.00g057560.m01.CDS01 [Anthostomella pinea]